MKLDGHKDVTRHLVHGLYYPPGKGCFADSRAHIDRRGGNLRDHMLAQGRESICIHSGIRDSKRTIDSADFNGAVHRDVKLFVLHGKVIQFQRAHDDCVGGCLIGGRQRPNRFEEIDVQP